MCTLFEVKIGLLRFSSPDGFQTVGCEAWRISVGQQRPAEEVQQSCQESIGRRKFADKPSTDQKRSGTAVEFESQIDRNGATIEDQTQLRPVQEANRTEPGAIDSRSDGGNVNRAKWISSAMQYHWKWRPESTGEE